MYKYDLIFDLVFFSSTDHKDPMAVESERSECER